MILTKRKFLYLLQFLFFINIFYWLPYVGVEILSLIKIFLIVLVILISILFLIKVKLNINFLYFLIFLFSYFLIYELLFFGGEYVKTGIVILIFYLIGYLLSDVDIKSTPKVFVLFFIVSCLWVVLSIFIPNLNYGNPLVLDYQLSYVMLSDTGFSIARTSWGLSVAFLAIYFYYISNNKILKNLSFFFSMLTVFLLATRGGMIYYIISLLVLLHLSEIKRFYKIVILALLTLIFVLIFYFFSDYLRISGSEDISAGRLDLYKYFYNIFLEDPLFGSYSEGGYDLKNFGLNVSHIHNAFLNLTLKYGVIGIFPFLLLLIFSINRIFKNYSSDLILLYLIIFIGLLSCFLEPESIFSYGYHVLIFWFVLGYCAFYQNMSEEK